MHARRVRILSEGRNFSLPQGESRRLGAGGVVGAPSLQASVRSAVSRTFRAFEPWFLRTGGWRILFGRSVFRFRFFPTLLVHRPFFRRPAQGGSLYRSVRAPLPGLFLLRRIRLLLGGCVRAVFGSLVRRHSLFRIRFLLPFSGGIPLRCRKASRVRSVRNRAVPSGIARRRRLPIPQTGRSLDLCALAFSGARC